MGESHFPRLGQWVISNASLREVNAPDRNAGPAKQTTMSTSLRWRVIGCGGIAARRTIPEFKKMASNSELVSVVDINPQCAKEVAAQFGAPHSCATVKRIEGKGNHGCQFHVTIL
jgi:hypothetical protein